MEYLVLSSILIFADFGQTKYISDSDNNFYEKNKIIGRNSSQTRVNIYFISALALNYSAKFVLNKKHANIFWASVASIQLGFVLSNAAIGVGFNYGIP